MLRIHLLGHPQIFNDDTLLPHPTPNKVFTLWAYLLLKGRRPIPRDHLAYVLWPDASESEARANLRRHLHLLRKQLPAPPQNAPWILSARQTVQWNPEADYWLDAAALEAFDVEKADKSDWASLIEACRGDLLEGFYDDWILAERAHLRQRYIQLLEQRITDQKRQGDSQGVVYTTRRLLTVDPLREESYRELMELHYRAGDRAAALREFEKCRTMLQSELDAEPMPETLALRDAILNGEALHLTADREPLTRSAPSAGQAADPFNTFGGAGRRSPIVDRQQTPSLSPPPVVSSRRKRIAWAGAGILLVLTLLAVSLRATDFLSSNSTQISQTLTLSGLDVTQDTWIDKDNPDLLYDPQDPDKMLKADYEQVHLMFWGFPYDRVLIRFDLERLPPDAKIEQAVFYHHLDEYTNVDLPESLPATISAFRLLIPWQPENATFNAPWSQPGLTAGVDYNSQALGSHAFHGETWFSVDITALAREWAAHPNENFGLMLMLTEAPQGAHYWVDTSNHPLTERRPRLEITYSSAIPVLKKQEF